MKKSPFYKQADLLIRILPHIAMDPNFALHGGTAINFFIRDLPRLSVDIDLTYLTVESREASLENISQKLRDLAIKLRRVFPGVLINEKAGEDKKYISKLIVNYQNALVKIEPNLTIRGSIFLAEEKNVSKKAEELFEKSASIKTLPFEALYGGKICAALDRQHPRDLFDIKLLMENEGVTDKVRRGFIIYLISHNRPMNELLNTKLKNIRSIFENEFQDMPLVPVTCEELEKVREILIKKIQTDLTEFERKFLLSFKKGNPEWKLMNFENVQNLPAVRWKLLNLEKMDRKKHSQSVDELKRILKL